MRDLQSPAWIKAKGLLFLLLGLGSGALLVFRQPELQTLGLLVICVWACCRFYYFAFYVIQHYVDPDHRFSGLLDFARYLFRHRPGRSPDTGEPRPMAKPGRERGRGL